MLAPPVHVVAVTMTNEQIQKMIEAGLPGAEVRVRGDGTHFEAVVVSEAFSGLSMVQQHQRVYACLGDSMQGAIHALSLRTYTPEKWASVSRLQGL